MFKLAVTMLTGVYLIRDNFKNNNDLGDRILIGFNTTLITQGELLAQERKLNVYVIFSTKTQNIFYVENIM